MGSPFIFNGRRAKNLTSDGLLLSDGSKIDSDGLINYIKNGHAEAATTGWATYADAASSRPVDGTGGSANITWTRSTSSPLRGTASFLLTKDAVNRQGEGVGYPFTIDAADKAKVIKISCDYAIASGTYSGGTSSTDSDVIAYIYDVTNSTLIEPAPIKLDGAVIGTQYKFNASFQAASNSTSYRLILHLATTSALAYSMQFDNFEVGPQVVSVGGSIGDWTSFTPTGSFTTNATYTGQWRRVGGDLEMAVKVAFTGATDAASFTLNLPSGLTIDTTRIPSTTSLAAAFPSRGAGVVGGSAKAFCATYSSTTAVAFRFESASGNGTTGNVSNTTLGTIANGDEFTVWVKVPIAGWGASQVLSSETDTRVLASHYSTLSSTTITGGTALNFTTVVTDKGGSLSAGAFRATQSGVHRVGVSGIATTAAVINLSVYVNDVSRVANIITLNSSYRLSGNAQVELNAGDLVTLVPSGAATAADTNANFTIERLSGPSQIAASETVSFAANTSTTAGTTSQCFIYTVVDQTHGAYSTTTGKFTAPMSGRYCFQWNNYTGATAAQGILHKNGTGVATGSSSVANTSVGAGSTTISLIAGDVVEIRPETNATASGSARLNCFSGFRVGN